VQLEYLQRHANVAVETEDTVMTKRAAEDEEQLALKAGQRPTTPADGDDDLDFEDEFEDEFESEDEIMEAGVDGRPDVDREKEAKGMCSI
jgi:ribosome assembly protein RRB1